jgi:SEC-C motif domain protein
MSCPCGSKRAYEDCCGPYITGAAKPPTAEALMRSRYTAFSQGAFDYVGETFADRSQSAAHAKGAKEWAVSGSFKRLKVMRTTEGGESDRRGLVEFTATYTQAGETWDHHEVSRFERNADGHWAYAGGNGHRHREGEAHHHHDHDHGRQTVRRDEPKTGRNDPCPCGSGKKFKKCCGA